MTILFLRIVHMLCLLLEDIKDINVCVQAHLKKKKKVFSIDCTKSDKLDKLFITIIRIIITTTVDIINF